MGFALPGSVSSSSLVGEELSDAVPDTCLCCLCCDDLSFDLVPELVVTSLGELEAGKPPNSLCMAPCVRSAFKDLLGDDIGSTGQSTCF